MAMRNLLMVALAGSSLLLAGAGHAQQAPSERPLSIAERQAAWSTHKTEYRRRLVRDGQASADRWLDQQALAERGETSTKPQTRADKKARADKKDCKKVRWVNRATPGFGGGPMTMSRVAVCADD